MRSLTYEQFRKITLLLIGLALAIWEIVFQHGADTPVMVFLAMMLGFQPAVKLDGLLRKTQTPTPDPAADKAAP